MNYFLITELYFQFSFFFYALDEIFQFLFLRTYIYCQFWCFSLNYNIYNSLIINSNNYLLQIITFTIYYVHYVIIQDGICFHLEIFYFAEQNLSIRAKYFHQVSIDWRFFFWYTIKRHVLCPIPSPRLPLAIRADCRKC